SLSDTTTLPELLLSLLAMLGI
ncbi:hypothetical protein A2U01_0105941, partial [Trifolium medium]|nr:hypothetical protein [Trifolium medium]